MSMYTWQCEGFHMAPYPACSDIPQDMSHVRTPAVVCICRFLRKREWGWTIKLHQLCHPPSSALTVTGTVTPRLYCTAMGNAAKVPESDNRAPQHSHLSRLCSAYFMPIGSPEKIYYANNRWTWFLMMFLPHTKGKAIDYRNHNVTM